MKKKLKITLLLYMSLMFFCGLLVQRPMPCYGQDILATIDIAPATLNLQSNGSVVTVHTDLPYNEVDPSTVFLNGIALQSSKMDDSGNFVAKFSRDEVKALEGLIIGDYNTFQLIGETTEGSFAGEDDIKIIDIEPQCLNAKLKLTSSLCSKYMNCWMKNLQNPNGTSGEDACLVKAESGFAYGWSRAEQKAKAGCATGSAEAVEDEILSGLDEIYGQVQAGIDPDDPNGPKLLKNMMKAVIRHCNRLLRAEMVKVQSNDLEKPIAAQNRANLRFQNTWERQLSFGENGPFAYSGPSMDEVMGMTEGLAESILGEMGI